MSLDQPRELSLPELKTNLVKLPPEDPRDSIYFALAGDLFSAGRHDDAFSILEDHGPYANSELFEDLSALYRFFHSLLLNVSSAEFNSIVPTLEDFYRLPFSYILKSFFSVQLAAHFDPSFREQIVALCRANGSPKFSLQANSSRASAGRFIRGKLRGLFRDQSPLLEECSRLVGIYFPEHLDVLADRGDPSHDGGQATPSVLASAEKVPSPANLSTTRAADQPSKAETTRRLEEEFVLAVDYGLYRDAWLILNKNRWKLGCSRVVSAYLHILVELALRDRDLDFAIQIYQDCSNLCHEHEAFWSEEMNEMGLRLEYFKIRRKINPSLDLEQRTA